MFVVGVQSLLKCTVPVAVHIQIQYGDGVIRKWFTVWPSCNDKMLP